MKSLTHQFLDFCRSKPADEAYDYCSNNNCAFAQFLISAGYSDRPSVAECGWRDRDGCDHPMPAGVEKALVKIDYSLPNRGRTFGALADRLAERLSA